MKKHIIFISLQSLVFVLFIFVYYSCQHDPVGLENQRTICFDKDVMPIIQSNCTMSGCHDGTGEERRNLSTYESISGMTTPGKPHQSNLYNSITKGGERLMPPSPKAPLTIDQRTTIFLWIAQGSKNTICDSTTYTPPPIQNDSVCFNLVILPILRSSCALSNCHDNITAAEGINLTSYQSMIQGEAGINGIMNSIDQQNMPPPNISPLSTDQIANFDKWYSQGAHNTICNSTSCDTINVTFAATISPMISNYCQGCHSGTSPAFNLRLANYTDIKTIADNGLLINTITQANGKPLMPPGSTLDNCRIIQIKKWINAGAPNN